MIHDIIYIMHFSMYDIIMTAATKRLFNTWIHYYAKIRRKNKANAGRYMAFKTDRFVNVLVLSLVSKVYLFEHSPLKSSIIIEIAGLMLFIRIWRESVKDWNYSRFWLGDLYKHVMKYR